MSSQYLFATGNGTPIPVATYAQFLPGTFPKRSTFNKWVKSIIQEARSFAREALAGDLTKDQLQEQGSACFDRFFRASWRSVPSDPWRSFLAACFWFFVYSTYRTFTIVDEGMQQGTIPELGAHVQYYLTCTVMWLDKNQRPTLLDWLQQHQDLISEEEAVHWERNLRGAVSVARLALALKDQFRCEKIALSLPLFDTTGQIDLFVWINGKLWGFQVKTGRPQVWKIPLKGHLPSGLSEDLAEVACGVRAAAKRVSCVYGLFYQVVLIVVPTMSLTDWWNLELAQGMVDGLKCICFNE